MTGGRAVPPDRPPVLPPPVRQPLAEWPLVAVAAVILAGLGGIYLHHYRLGSAVVGLGVLLAALLRLALPVRRAGMLTVRSRPLDVAVLLGIGTAVLALAIVVPRQHS